MVFTWLHVLCSTGNCVGDDVGVVVIDDGVGDVVNIGRQFGHPYCVST